MNSLAIIVLVLVFAVALWGGLIAGPSRLVPLLIFASTLVLPPHVKMAMPGIPDIDKVTAVTLPALLLLFATERERWRRFRTVWPDLFLYAFVAWAFLCVLLNQGPWAAGSRLLWLTAFVIVPWIAGRLFLQSSEDLRVLVRAMLPMVILYLIPMAIEAVRAPFIRDRLYGVWAPADYRLGIYRPVVFADDALELGHYLCMVAAVLWGAYCGWRGRNERVPLFMLLGITAAVGGAAMSVSRGPVTGLALAFGLPLLIGNTRWPAMLIALTGVGLFAWMLSPAGSGAAAAEVLAPGEEDIGSYTQTLNFRFLQIDYYKPMVAQSPLIGYGESWQRVEDMPIIDGILLIYLLGYGYPGMVLMVMFWLAVILYIGRQAYPGNTPYAFIGRHLAPLVGWLVFSAWGDSFLRQPHMLMMSAVVGAMYAERQLSRPLLAPVKRMVFVSG